MNANAGEKNMAAIDSLLHRLTAVTKLLSVAVVALAAVRPVAADDQAALTVVGRVQDALIGKPIEGAKVTITRFADGDTRHVLNRIETTSDADGQYRFTLPTDHPYTPPPTIRGYGNGTPIFGPATPPGFPIRVEVRHAEYAGKTDHMTIPLEPPDAGATRNRSDQPVPSAGWFRPDEHHPSERGAATFELLPGKEVFGVLQTPDGRPAEGIEVHATSTMPRNETHVTRPGGNGERYLETSALDTVVTDADGQFRIGLITPGSATLSIYPDKDFAPLIRELYDKRGDLGIIKLRRGIVVKGRAFDVEGKPLADVEVEAVTWEPGTEYEKTFRREAITDAQGNFMLGTLPPGQFRLEPKPHYESPYMDENGQMHGGNHALPGIFFPKKLTLADGRDPPTIEVRALPTVSIEGRAVGNEVNARGFGGTARFSPGATPAFVEGTMDGQVYRAPITLSAGNWPPNPNMESAENFSIKLPRGLSDTVVEIDTQRVVAGNPSRTQVQWRLGKESPLQSTTKIRLGTLDHDIHDLEIVYTPELRRAPAAAAPAALQGGGRGGRVAGRGGVTQPAQ
jgi:hypothetical protein